MSADVLSATANVVTASLLRASLEGGLLALLVLAACRFVPALSPRVRCWLWWMVGLKLLLSLAGVGLVRVPLFPPAAPVAPTAFTALPGTGVLEPPARPLPAAPAPAVSVLVPLTQAASDLTDSSSRFTSWRALLAGLWLAGALAGLVALGREVWAVRRLRRSAASVPADDAARAYGDLPGRFGLAAAPPLKISTAVSGPQVVGLARPQILLPPEGLADLGRPELGMLLAHELAHVRRGDLWLGWVPALTQKLFFFHPLAALAVREYSLAREAACDSEVLRLLGSAPQEYGRMLLRWGVALRETGLAAAGASSSARNLKRRLEMLHDASQLVRQGPRRSSILAGLALAALLPIQIIAKSPATPAAPATPAVAVSSSVAATPVVAMAPTTPATTVAARPAVASMVPVVARPWRRRPALRRPPRPAPAYSYSDDEEDDLQAWAYVEGDGSSMTFNGSGSTADWKRIRGLTAKSGEPLLWFRRDGKSFVVRDAALLAEAKKLIEPMTELGRQQGELGAQQGELGGQQGELGARQGELGGQQGQLGAQQGRLGAEQGKLAARQAALAIAHDDDEDSSAALARQRAQLDAEMEKLSRQMDELGRQQEALGDKQEELGRQQEALGREQEKLGEKQEALGQKQEEASGQAGKAIALLFDRALAGGKAEEVR